MKYIIKNFLIAFMILFVFVVPTIIFAQESGNGLIPCGGKGQNECGFNDLLALVNNIINWIIIVSIPIATGVIAWAGILYMTTGVAGTKEQAKKMIQKVLMGFAAILAAWLIVTTMINALLDSSFRENVDLGANNITEYHA
jgi:hypothetical protein